MDRMGFWNVRGLNDPVKQHEIKNFLFQHRFSLFILIETSVKPSNWQQVFKFSCLGMECINNYQSAVNGRIWCIWDKKKVVVRELAQSDQFIHMEVDVLANQFRFLCTAIYAANTAACRSQLWTISGCILCYVAMDSLWRFSLYSLCGREMESCFVDHDIDELQN